MACLNPDYCQSAINQLCDNCVNDRLKLETDTKEFIDKWELTKEELIILYKFLEHMHIPYDNYPLLQVIRKLADIADDEV